MANANVAFNDVIEYIKENPEKYIYNFNFSACELWLCNEICRILNFENSKGIVKDDKEFAYNEDHKRDLSIYKSINKNKSNLLEHIEVKIVYPSQFLHHQNNWLDSLFNKLDCSSTKKMAHNGYHGWVFFVWTSDDKYKKILPDSDSFFTRDTSFIHDKIGFRYTSETGFRCVDILDDSFMWRGEEKRIVVKGMQFTKNKK